jgi:hypothetical protein
MDRRSQAPEKIGVSQGKSTRRTDYSRRIESQSDAKGHRQQDKPAANQRRTSSSNEFKIKPSASKSDDSSHQVLQPTRRRDSIVPNSSHEKKSPISLQQRRIESQSDAKSHRQQDKPAAIQRRTSSSNEFKIKPNAYGASNGSLQVLQPTWRRDSVVSHSSHEKISPISLQQRQPIPHRYSSKSHLVSVRSLDAGRRQKKIAGGGGPGEESSSKQQPLVDGSSETKNQEPTRQQTYDKEGADAYNNAYDHFQGLYNRKEITFEQFDKATADLKAAFIEKKNKGWTADL